MKNTTKFSILAFIFMLAGLTIYGFSIFRDRDEKAKSTSEKNIDSSLIPTETIEQESITSSIDNKPFIDNSAVDSPTDNLSDENTPDEKNNYLDVSKTDCGNSCKDFTEPADLKYCQQICGIMQVKKDVKEKKGCDALNDLEKDYCLKDLAINTKNINICTEIADTDVQKVCKNRIAQDLLESEK